MHILYFFTLFVKAKKKSIFTLLTKLLSSTEKKRRSNTKTKASTDEDKRENFKCSKCSFENIKESAVYRHEIRSHKPDRDENGLMDCKICGRKYSKIQRLINHLYACNRILLLFSCRLCPYTGARKRRLKIHYRRVHRAVEVSELEKIFCQLDRSKNKLIKGNKKTFWEVFYENSFI